MALFTVKPYSIPAHTIHNTMQEAIYIWHCILLHTKINIAGWCIQLTLVGARLLVFMAKHASHHCVLMRGN